MNGPDPQQQQLAASPDKGASKPKHVKRLTVSKKFREIAKKCLPGLDFDPAHWQFFGYLLFGSSFDEDSGKLLIGQPKLAKVIGEDANNFVAITYLEKFQREVMPTSFEWRKYSKDAEKCRQVDRCEWPDELKAAILDEIDTKWHNEGRLYLDGTAYSEGKRKKARLADKAEAEVRGGIGPDAQMIQQYMNEREPNLFTEIVKKNYDAALEVAKSLPNERSREAQLRMLRRIFDQRQPFYSPSFDGNTVRLFASDHIPNLQGDVRRALTKGWPEADLKSAQLAICARLWEIPVVLDFLKTGQSVWTHLAESMNVPANHISAAKPVLKEALYSVCYGQLERVVKAQVTKGLNPFGIEKAGQRFVQNDIISALLLARDSQIERINREGGALDCYGKSIRVTEDREARQILAEQAQAVEMQLLAPVFQLARVTADFRITLYQFDGLSIHFGKKEREPAWRRKIGESVKNKAESLKILTELEWKD
jgi:hypothetical protein